MHTDGRLDPVVDVRHDLTFDQLDLRAGTVEVTTGPARCTRSRPMRPAAVR